MGLLDKYKNEVVHTRNIKISTFGSDKGGIIVEGELIENRSKLRKLKLKCWILRIKNARKHAKVLTELKE